MGAYAALSDVQARYEAAVIDRICMDTESDEPDYTKLTQALADASTEIDSYVSTRYPVPMNPVPTLLKTICIDLGLYYCALTWDKLTDEIKARADNWRKHLVLIAKGQAGLGVRVDQETDQTVIPEGTGSQSALTARAVRT
jgi:phage gp36-like protein